MQNKKLKILCFHGFGTNASFMKKQMKHVNKLLSPYADCVYLNAPYLVNPNFVERAVTDITGDEPLYSWFQYKAFSEQQVLDATIKNIVNILDQHGPCDGLIGFSQGGAVLHLIILLKTRGLLKHKYLDNIKFCIFMCSLWWRFELIEPVLSTIKFPTLHILSKSDFTFRNTSNALVKYLDPVIIFHGQGHKIPRLGNQQFTVLMKFIRSAMQNKPVMQNMATF